MFRKIISTLFPKKRKVSITCASCPEVLNTNIKESSLKEFFSKHNKSCKNSNLSVVLDTSSLTHLDLSYEMNRIKKWISESQ